MPGQVAKSDAQLDSAVEDIPDQARVSVKNRHPGNGSTINPK